MQDKDQPSDPNGEMLATYYFGDRPKHPSIWTTPETRRQMAEAEAQRIAGLNWFWRWVEKHCR